MAVQKAKSGLAAKLGAKGHAAVEGHKNDETVFQGGGDLPAGIENGIAQLVECKFDIVKEGDNKGEYYFYAGGVVVTPKSIMTDEGEFPIEGMRTSITEPLYDTPSRSRKTVDDHLAWILNELRKLGVDTSEVSLDNLEATAAAVKESGTTFRFRTWKGEATEQYPNPRVNHQWAGAVDYEMSSEDDVQEEVAAAPKTTKTTGKATTAKANQGLDSEAADNGDEDAQRAIAAAARELGIDPEDASFADWAAVHVAVEEAKLAPASEEESDLGALADAGDEAAVATLNEQCEAAGIDPNAYATWVDVVSALAESGAVEATEEVFEDVHDLEGLGALADGGDEDAAAKLNEACEAAGVDPNAYASWADVEEVLKAAPGSGEQEIVPQVGEIYMYQDPKNPKAKPVECEVTAVNETASTVDLKNSVSKALYKGVAWAVILA